ncbi:hypothetical protein SDC9_132944 [bioreactor metagenome]|uniref:Uncharacterized protein n=1 Tax=bioreactor metagenome TaxID=1076179 RepID=A0A645D9A7_9ZZZZ
MDRHHAGDERILAMCAGKAVVLRQRRVAKRRARAFACLNGEIAPKSCEPNHVGNSFQPAGDGKGCLQNIHKTGDAARGHVGASPLSGQRRKVMVDAILNIRPPICAEKAVKIRHRRAGGDAVGEHAIHMRVPVDKSRQDQLIP